jgi:hypothetical protein
MWGKVLNIIIIWSLPSNRSYSWINFTLRYHIDPISFDGSIMVYVSTLCGCGCRSAALPLESTTTTHMGDRTVLLLLLATLFNSVWPQKIETRPYEADCDERRELRTVVFPAMCTHATLLATISTLAVCYKALTCNFFLRKVHQSIYNSRQWSRPKRMMCWKKSWRVPMYTFSLLKLARWCEGIIFMCIKGYVYYLEII